jgi:hypothetical protein
VVGGVQAFVRVLAQALLDRWLWRQGAASVCNSMAREPGSTAAPAPNRRDQPDSDGRIAVSERVASARCPLKPAGATSWPRQYTDWPPRWPLPPLHTVRRGVVTRR